MSGEESVEVRGSRREAGSNELRPASRIRGELVDSREIGLLKVGMLVENLLFIHAGTQPPEDIPDRDSKSADARLSPALTRFDGDSADAGCRHWKIRLHTSMPSIANKQAQGQASGSSIEGFSPDKRLVSG
jgi:hypothetical protein